MSLPNSAVEIQFRLYPAARQLGTSTSDAPASGSGRLPRVTQVVALAIHFQDMILRGEARDYADVARLGCLTRERMSQVMELIWLAPDIQQDILYLPPTPGGRYPISERAARKIAAHFAWAQQRIEWNRLKQSWLGGSR